MEDHRELLEETAAEVTRLIVGAKLHHGQPRVAASDLPDLQHIARGFWATEQPHLRLSHGADCALHKWLVHNRADEAKPHDTMTRLMFAIGHLAEALLKQVLIDELAVHPTISWVDGSDQLEVYNPDNIVGHIDGLLEVDGNHILFDFKTTASYAIGHWEDGRMPPAMWGHRHQGGNYLDALERLDMPITPIGMLWPAYARDKGFMKTGWATHAELIDYALEAQRQYDHAVMGMPPPAPCHAGRDKSPCRARAKIYCDFYDYCTENF